MILTDVMAQLATRLQTIAVFQQVFDRPVDSISPPVAMVAWPESVTYDGTYRRGMDNIKLPVLVIVGRVSDTAARDQLGRHVDGTGTSSVKQVLESGTYTAFDTVRVEQVTFDVITYQDVDYLAATFTLDIAGQGA